MTGKSLLHVPQGVGILLTTDKIGGYYNDLTQKVMRDANNLENVEYIPTLITESGKETEFAIAVIQYGLGCYDLFLQNGNKLYLTKFYTCVDWI